MFVWVYLIDLVCSWIFANSDSECGFIWHRYSQLHIRHTVIILGHSKDSQKDRHSVVSHRRGTGKKTHLFLFFYLIWFRQELLHDVTFSNDSDRAHCRWNTHYIRYSFFCVCVCKWNKSHYTMTSATSPPGHKTVSCHINSEPLKMVSCL